MIQWQPNPDCNYMNDYAAIFAHIADMESQEPAEVKGQYKTRVYRQLILDDLYFVVQFVLEIPPLTKDGNPFCNHPFVIEACYEIQTGPKDFTLDIYAREHFKTSIITIAETIQYALKNPNEAQGIFSYVRPVAKTTLFSIKEMFETRQILKTCFPDVVWENPHRDAPMWSLDEGIVLRRHSTRREPSISAWGLTEGMPTGFHFERRVYDDIVTEDIGESIDMMEKVKMKFDSSQNLGKEGGVHRVTGTYYNYNDPLMYIKDKVTEDGAKLYKLRLKPATDDGTRNGKPLFLSQTRFNNLKLTRSFDCQQLLNPTPDDVKKLRGELFMDIEEKFIPKDIFKFMVVDPAGDDKDGRGDSWSMMVCGVEPRMDDLGLSTTYILDAIISPMREEDAPDEATRMYLRNGMIMQLGVEKVGQSSAEIHIVNALAKRGRHLSVDNGSLVILRPAGRAKTFRINNNLAWPLFNNKVFISNKVPQVYRDRIRLEADRFPAWHDDALDSLAYLYDMTQVFKFGWYEEDDEPKKVVNMTGRSRYTGY